LPFEMTPCQVPRERLREGDRQVSHNAIVELERGSWLSTPAHQSSRDLSRHELGDAVESPHRDG
jgi:hypothetical protein